MSDVPEQRATLRLRAKADKRVSWGYPWVFSNEIEMNAAAKAQPAGAAVRLETAEGKPLGCFLFNRHPLIAARRLSADPDARIDVAFLEARLRDALELRERLIPTPHYRLVHAEADGLPGLIVDRFGDALALQVNTAGMERLTGPLLEALDRLLAPATVVLRNDSGARELEGLDSEVRIARGALEAPIELLENGARHFADLREGQKTGWFFDQRDNRAWVARLVSGAKTAPRVLDTYSFTGGFSLQAALAGAAEVVAVDRSRAALDLAARAAEANGVADRCSFRKSDVFAAFEHLQRSGERFDLVITDPPAFVKGRKDLPQGLRGYRKLARLAAGAVVEGGYLVICSCSHHVDPTAFAEQVRRGLHDAGRGARVIHRASAGPDHPLHPALPESDYLKALFLKLD